jgi:hypothetical protein
MADLHRLVLVEDVESRDLLVRSEVDSQDERILGVTDESSLYE